MHTPRPMEIEEIIYLALENGIISRGKACAALKIDRCDLDKWVLSVEQKLEDALTRDNILSMLIESKEK